MKNWGTVQGLSEYSVKDVKLIFQQIYLLDVKVLTPNLFEVT